MVFPEIEINMRLTIFQIKETAIGTEELEVFFLYIIAQRLADINLQVVFRHDFHVRRNTYQIPILLDKA